MQGCGSPRLTSYARLVLAGLASNCGFFLANTEEVKDKGKNSWDLIACATSDKLESPKEAAIDLYLCLYVTWVFSLCNFPGTSSRKFNEERNTGVCSLLP